MIDQAHRINFEGESQFQEGNQFIGTFSDITPQDRSPGISKHKQDVLFGSKQEGSMQSASHLDIVGIIDPSEQVIPNSVMNVNDHSKTPKPKQSMNKTQMNWESPGFKANITNDLKSGM